MARKGINMFDRMGKMNVCAGIAVVAMCFMSIFACSSRSDVKPAEKAMEDLKSNSKESQSVRVLEPRRDHNGRAISVGFILPGIGDFETGDENSIAMRDFAKSNFKTTEIAPSSAGFKDSEGKLHPYDKRDFDVLWINATGPQTTPEMFADKHVLEAVEGYVRDGGGLLLTCGGGNLLKLLNLESSPIHYSEPAYNSTPWGGVFRIPDAHSSHPIFSGFQFYPVVETSNKGRCASYGFSNVELKNPEALVLSEVWWDLWANKKKSNRDILEYKMGKGRVLFIGGALPYFSLKGNIYRDNLEKLFLNAMNYLSDSAPAVDADGGLTYDKGEAAPSSSLRLSSGKVQATLKATLSIFPEKRTHPVNRKLFGLHMTHDRFFDECSIWNKKTNTLNTQLADKIKSAGISAIRWNIHSTTLEVPRRSHTLDEMITCLRQDHLFSSYAGIPFSRCATFLGGCSGRYEKDGAERMKVDDWGYVIKKINLKDKLGLGTLEIWNEPWMWNWDVDEYAEYALDVGKKVKSIDPSLKIAISGNWGLDNDVSLLLKTKEVVDSLVVHYYFGTCGAQTLDGSYSCMFSGVENFRQMARNLTSEMRNKGVDKKVKIIMTEWACERGILSQPENLLKESSLMQAIGNASFLTMIMEENILDSAYFHMFLGTQYGFLTGRAVLSELPTFKMFQLFTKSTGDYIVDKTLACDKFYAVPDISSNSQILPPKDYKVGNVDVYTDCISVLPTINSSTGDVYAVIINKSLRNDAALKIHIDNKHAPKHVYLSELNVFPVTDAGVMDTNFDQKTKLYSDNVKIEKMELDIHSNSFEIILGKHSINAIKIVYK